MLAGIAVAGWWLFYKERTKPVETITKIETKIDTCYIDKPKLVFTQLVGYKFFDFPVESVVYVDSTSNYQVEIPIEKKVFTDDSTYRATVSGFQPNLDAIELYNRTTTVTQTQLVYRKPIVTLSLGASCVWNPVTKQFDYGVGVSIGIPVWSWYF